MSSENKVIVVPHSNKSEMMVLGCMLTNPNAYEIACKKLESQDFYYEQHKLILDVMKKAYKDERPCDTLLVCEELKRQGKLESAGGAAYVTTLAQYAGTSAYIEEYVDIILKKSLVRNVIYTAQEIEKKGLDNPDNVSELLEYAQHKFEQIRQIAELERNNASFFENLGNIIDDKDFADSLENRNYDTFEREHKRLFSSGGLTT
ncbi:MAG: DnaB-like helicase N-terminal domain-containing protein, partial [Chryseobacterium sp.]